MVDKTKPSVNNYGRSPDKEHLHVSGAGFISENTGNIKDFYKISSCIGRGAYGEVRKCLHKETKALRAVKIINKKFLEQDEKDKLQSEIAILKSMDHPNILKLYEFFQDHKRYFLVTELCNGGELFERISEQHTFSERDAANIIKQVLSALTYCHQRNIVHRDMKPENLLLDKDPNNPKVTIIDFGTSGVIDPAKKMSQKFGTPYYIAPEVLKKNYDQKCDLWSVGVILFILLCGYPPFNGPNDKHIIQAVLSGKFSLNEPEWEGVSTEAKDLVKKLLTYNPANRISAFDAFNHPWIKKMASSDRVNKDVAIKTLQNLQNFRANNELKQATMAFIASHLTSKDEKRDLEKIFKSMDKDGNGTLDREEVLAGYEEHFGVAITEEMVDAMFAAVDLDGNNCIDYTEFVMATMNEKDLITNDKLKAAFRLFDKDNNGTISPNEIRSALGIDSSDKHLNSLIAEVDENGDGEIQFDEFCSMMRKLAL